MIINENLYLSDCENLTSLGNLREVKKALFVGGDTYSLEKLGNLEKVGYISMSDNIEDLGNLKEITFGSLDLHNSYIKSLNNLERVGKDLNLRYCGSLKDLGKIVHVHGSIHLEECRSLKTLGEIKFIYGKTSFIYLRDSGITRDYIKEFKPKLLSKCRFK